jgi:hypothetical protein
MTDETTTEQLAEIEGQAESTPVTGYTPPEGWRVLQVGEVLRDGDLWVNHEGELWPTKRVGETVNDERYIRRIEPEPQPEPHTELQAQVAFLKGREVTLGTRLQQEREVTTRLRGDLELMQKLLGTERRKVAQLEDLVASLRTINEAQEKAFEAAGQHNSDLQSRFNAVCSEWSQQAETIRRLQIELDAAQQVPQAIADRFEEGWNQGTARAVETVLAWLEPIRAVDHPNLSNETLQHLPQIMRHLTGLTQD